MHVTSSMDAYDRSSVCGVRLLVMWVKGALQSGGRGLQGPTVAAAHNVLLSMLSAGVSHTCSVLGSEKMVVKCFLHYTVNTKYMCVVSCKFSHDSPFSSHLFCLFASLRLLLSPLPSPLSPLPFPLSPLPSPSPLSPLPSPLPSYSRPSTWQTHAVSMWCCRSSSSLSARRDLTRQTWRPCWTE